jgi:hypothetical protein
VLIKLGDQRDLSAFATLRVTPATVALPSATTASRAVNGSSLPLTKVTAA